jgi:hypothetical protein
MSPPGRQPQGDPAQFGRGFALASLLGQVGCLTVLIVFLALGAGLWIDSRLGTRPWITLALVLGSVPLTLALMFRVVLSGAARWGQAAEGRSRAQEETDVEDA